MRLFHRKKLCVWIVFLWLLQGTYLTLVLTFLFNILSNKTQFKSFSNTEPRKCLHLTILKLIWEEKKRKAVRYAGWRVIWDTVSTINTIKRFWVFSCDCVVLWFISNETLLGQMRLATAMICFSVSKICAIPLAIETLQYYLLKVNHNVFKKFFNQILLIFIMKYWRGFYPKQC